ncbi:endonuclease V [Clostridia bacterium]|nr:endonuclease V [Clostridia bacterium]
MKERKNEEKPMRNEYELQFKQEYKRWQEKISLKNSFSMEQLEYVAGVDVVEWSENAKDYGICCISVLNYRTKELLERVEYAGRIDLPYISGYRALRQLPLVLEAQKKLKHEPDLYFFNGNGYLNQFPMGIATLAAFYLRKPSIGAAKNGPRAKGLSYTKPPSVIGKFTDIMADTAVCGAVVCTKKNAHPVFVTCGNWIDLKTSIQLVLSLSERTHPLPLPIRYAQMATREGKVKYENIIH